MTDIEYLATPIVAAKSTEVPRYGMTVDGYTKRSGAPTSWMVKLEGENRWRRIMVICFSNVGSCFIRIGGRNVYVQDYKIPDKEFAS